jgi:hypothetical protein
MRSSQFWQNYCVSTLVVALEHTQKHPAAALVRNELGIVLELAKQGGASVAALRDLIWLEFGVIGAAGEA